MSTEAAEAARHSASRVCGIQCVAALCLVATPVSLCVLAMDGTWHRPSILDQTRGAARKNFAVKYRNRKQTCFELLYPLFWTFVVVSPIAKAIQKPLTSPPVLCSDLELPACEDGWNCPMRDGCAWGPMTQQGPSWESWWDDPCENGNQQGTILFAPITPATSAIVQDVVSIATDDAHHERLGACIKGYSSRAALEADYLDLEPNSEEVNSVAFAIYFSEAIGEDPDASAAWSYTIAIPQRYDRGDGKTWCDSCQAGAALAEDQYKTFMKAGVTGGYQKMYRKLEDDMFNPLRGTEWAQVTWLQWALDLAIAAQASPLVNQTLSHHPPAGWRKRFSGPPFVWVMPLPYFSSEYQPGDTSRMVRRHAATVAVTVAATTCVSACVVLCASAVPALLDALLPLDGAHAVPGVHCKRRRQRAREEARRRPAHDGHALDRCAAVPTFPRGRSFPLPSTAPPRQHR